MSLMKVAIDGITKFMDGAKQAVGKFFGIDSSGIVLPPDDLERLFRKFFRGSNSMATYGTGLGLAVCKAIVELHGGKIKAAQKK